VATLNRQQRVAGAAVGLASAGIALGIAELIAALTGPRSAPVVAVGGVVIDSVPAPVKEFATTTFGTHDKTALLTGTFLLLAAFAIMIGIYAVRDIRFGYAGIAVFGLIGAAAAWTRPGLGFGSVFPSLIGAGAGAAAMAVLLHGWRPPRPDLETSEGRRSVLIGAIVALAGAGLAELIGRQLGERSNVTAARNAVRLPSTTATPSQLPPDAAVDEQTTFVTPNGEFYRIDTALVVPQVDPTTWTLKIHGMVDKPLTLTYAQLLARPMIERYITLCCVSNPVGGDLVGNALFLGAPLKDLLEEVGVHAGADQVVGRSADGFTAGSPTAVLMDGRDAMLAVGMNGEPLPTAHGFPVRVVVPGLYGYVSATKWITELEVTTFAAFDAYWVQRDWVPTGTIQTESRIDTPSDGSTKNAGPTVIAGVAWAQHRGISKVEVQVDSGPWRVATLDPVPSTDTWRQWKLNWNATPGSHRIQVRATDNSGQTQTSAIGNMVNGKYTDSTGYHQIKTNIR
jgi:DMSO/TMAO reductase YedYZ molybdopterin-dependent catalytic subunit